VSSGCADYRIRLLLYKFATIICPYPVCFRMISTQQMINPEISLTVSPVHDTAGGIVGASSIAHIITESERRRAQAQAASQYFRSLVEASPDP
jgi:hypothetical protein